ncbi:hypothetical protein BD309DRAFT_948016 [Dichomitus squalens]|uniref:Uncharacterized protein n=1 Tax=Dichomitus squalens TaxID=114155 RepID=A0A4V6MWV4_9APHY|nr:uncharacterized protein DICSQDRAFT_160038 [Dichomitus squalens LYAD-421 SS1]EJF64175.1 hypothetical protein DICSQDRAFT_160038 [Dichomitus squalens LYAD-421 SS1]TBU49237.1 hypothetical protein BD309DRAFT_948016 [Dichomitus squalens]TBU60898.1 hypothetical protein BD310DRAFT_921708 [Dichomitus squalens]
MPPAHAHIMNSGFATVVAHHSPFQEDDDDDLDDICPVCESECTCHKKPSVPSTSSAPTPSASSSHSSAPSTSHQTTAAGKRPLKIKLTLPPNLKSRKPPETQPHSSSSAHLGSAVPDAGPSSRPPVHAAAPAPKRRGRPPKALAAAKYNARKRTVADDMEYKARGTSGTSATVRRVYQPPIPAASTSSADLSDSTLSDYPTFVPAASESTHSSSSESSDSSIDSDSDGDDHYIVRNDSERRSTKLLPSHVGHKKRERIGGNKWEIKPRKKSVGADEDEDEESSTDSGDSSDADSSEDGDDENEDDVDEADVEADVEGGGLLAEDIADLDEEEETHSRIGVSFPGDGWSDDEESSFDADVFFAGLDSDSGASSPEMHFATLRASASGEDAEPSGSFSADEEDALLLMDIDPSVQLRRGHGEFEIGVDLDNLSFGWDGQLLFSSAGTGPGDGLALSFSLDAPDEDEEMASISGLEDTSSFEDSGTGTVILHESDGDTTEDELVDSDGLPNPRAMMLFKWPSTISAINPLSTLSPSSFSDPPPNATPSTRIALASISSQRWSPPPTPSPADILAGRVSMDDLEDIEMEKLDKQKGTPMRRRGSGIPIMGEFTVGDAPSGRKTAVVGAGGEVPSFYRRAVRLPKPESVVEDVLPDEDATMSALRSQVVAESSEEHVQEMSQHSYASDSTTEAIDLDDVLDSSLLDDEPSNQECETDVPGSQSQSSPTKLGTSPHLHNLSRWDRIPMATFRRTRETATASGVDGAASDSGLAALQHHRGISAMMSGMPLITPPRPLGLDKMSRASARKKKGRHSYNSSPTLLPARDGQLGSPFVPAAGSSYNGHTNKSKKELKKEKAMMKRKMTTKASQHRYNQPHRAHHHHHPNHKSRATNAVQRSGFSAGASSSIPSLTI